MKISSNKTFLIIIIVVDTFENVNINSFLFLIRLLSTKFSITGENTNGYLLT